MSNLASVATNLSDILEKASEGLDELKKLMSDPRPLDQVLADPDSPVNAQRTLASLRLEAAAQREALRPFAQAYTRMAEPLDDVQIPVFVDANRPEKNRFVYMADFKRAHKAYHSPTIGTETAERLVQLDADMKRAGELLTAWIADDGPFGPEDLEDSKRLADRYGGTSQCSGPK